MPVLYRRVLGLILLVATIGLATCQSMVKAGPPSANESAGTALDSGSRPEQ
jgi:hypothetical protein